MKCQLTNLHKKFIFPHYDQHCLCEQLFPSLTSRGCGIMKGSQYSSVFWTSIIHDHMLIWNKCHNCSKVEVWCQYSLYMMRFNGHEAWSMVSWCSSCPKSWSWSSVVELLNSYITSQGENQTKERLMWTRYINGLRKLYIHQDNYWITCLDKILQDNG